MEDSRADGKAFTNFVLFVPLLLIPPWLPTRILGCVALAYVLTRCWSATRRDPVLLAFLGFGLAVMVADDFGGRELHDATVPYTGWSATSPYGYSIFFAVVGLALGIPPAGEAISRVEALRGEWGRFGVVAMCLVQVAMGCYDWATAGVRWSLNPYLRVSVWQPVWTVFIPLTWAVMILLFRPRAAESGESGVRIASRPTSG